LERSSLYWKEPIENRGKKKLAKPYGGQGRGPSERERTASAKKSRRKKTKIDIWELRVKKSILARENVTIGGRQIKENSQRGGQSDRPPSKQQAAKLNIDIKNFGR